MVVGSNGRRQRILAAYGQRRPLETSPKLGVAQKVDSWRINLSLISQSEMME